MSVGLCIKLIIKLINAEGCMAFVDLYSFNTRLVRTCWVIHVINLVLR